MRHLYNSHITCSFISCESMFLFSLLSLQPSYAGLEQQQEWKISNVQYTARNWCYLHGIFTHTKKRLFHCIFKYRYLLKYYVDVDIWILSTDIYSQCGVYSSLHGPPATRHVISASHLSPVRAAVRVIIPSIWRGEAHWLELIVITYCDEREKPLIIS